MEGKSSILELVHLSLDDSAIDTMIPLVKQAIVASKSSSTHDQRGYHKKQLSADNALSYNWSESPRLKPKSDHSNTEAPNTPTLSRRRRVPPPPPVQEATKITKSNFQSESNTSQKSPTEKPIPKPRRRVPPPPPVSPILSKRERAVSSPDTGIHTRQKPGLLFSPPQSRSRSLNKKPTSKSLSTSPPFTKPHQATTFLSQDLPLQHIAPSKTLPYQSSFSSKSVSPPIPTALPKLIPPRPSLPNSHLKSFTLPPTKPLPPLPTEDISSQTPTSDCDYAFIPDLPPTTVDTNIISPYSSFRANTKQSNSEHKMISGADELDNDEHFTRTTKPDFVINSQSQIDAEEEYITMASNSQLSQNTAGLQFEEDVGYISMSPSHQPHNIKMRSSKQSDLLQDEYVTMLPAAVDEYITMTSPKSQATDDSDLKPAIIVHKPTPNVEENEFTSMYVDLDMIKIRAPEEKQEGQHPKSRYLIQSSSAPVLPRGSKDTKSSLKKIVTPSSLSSHPISHSVSKPQKYTKSHESNDTVGVGVYATIPEIHNLYYS